MEEDYEEELDQAGLILRRLTIPFGRGRFQEGLKVLERMPVGPSAWKALCEIFHKGVKDKMRYHMHFL